METIQEKIDPDLEKPSKIISQLLAAVERATPTESKFEIEVLDLKLHFRVPANMTELARFKRVGIETILLLSKPDGAVPADVREAANGLDIDDFTAAFSVHYWSTEPSKISLSEALKLCRAPFLMDKIIRAIDLHHDFESRSRVFSKIEAAKKKSKPITSSVRGSRSAKKSTENIATNLRTRNQKT